MWALHKIICTHLIIFLLPSRFSRDLGSQLHFAHCYVPTPVAHVMSHDPQLISAAVHALCDRDPIDMQACQKMTYFSPRKHKSVMTGIKFTRCLYAKLLNQRFSSPRNSGFSVPPSNSLRHAACEMGMKLVSLGVYFHSNVFYCCFNDNEDMWIGNSFKSSELWASQGWG